MSKEETLGDFKLFLKNMTNDLFELRIEVAKLKASSRSKFLKELQELKQGSMSVKEYFDEMHIAMLRAKVRESSDATMDRFLNGLNPSISKQMDLYPYSDIKGMVSIAIELEKLMKKKERNREKEKMTKERETYEKELKEKRKIESERESEIEMIIVIESDLSENKVNACFDEDKVETFADADFSSPSVALSPLQELDYNDGLTKVVSHGKDDRKESRTTLLQERENDSIHGAIRYQSLKAKELIHLEVQQTLQGVQETVRLSCHTWRMTWVIAWVLTWMIICVEVNVTHGRAPPKPPWHGGVQWWINTSNWSPNAMCNQLW